MSETLVVSISGIRGIFGRGLSPTVIVDYASAYGDWILQSGTQNPLVVVGRDARVTGELCANLVMSTLQSQGIDVIDAGLATTPTVEMAVIKEDASGGIILSASHNPAEWNALKLLNGEGEFLSPAQAAWVIERAQSKSRNWISYDKMGSKGQKDYLDYHIAAILKIKQIDPVLIGKQNYKVVVDAVNSVGGRAIPAMLMALGVKEQNIVKLHCEPTGLFAHPAEPLPENLTEVCERVKMEGADLGFVVDPDADRLALIAPGGIYVSEELTQVLAAAFWWKSHKGSFVTNLSSSRAVEIVAGELGNEVFRSPVGEINVVEEMKARGAVIGGEGNGGVILPELHYGRDALVGVAMILQYMAEEQKTLAELVGQLPTLHIAKMKTDIGDHNPDSLLEGMARKYKDEKISTIDGVKIDFPEGWVHMRKSNTEPIIRVYAEAGSKQEADALGTRFMEELLRMD